MWGNVLVSNISTTFPHLSGNLLPLQIPQLLIHTNLTVCNDSRPGYPIELKPMSQARLLSFRSQNTYTEPPPLHKLPSSLRLSPPTQRNTICPLESPVQQPIHSLTNTIVGRNIWRGFNQLTCGHGHTYQRGFSLEAPCEVSTGAGEVSTGASKLGPRD